MIKLDWQTFSKLTEARSRFAKTPCISKPTLKDCPIRVVKATEGFEATNHTKRIVPRRKLLVSVAS